MKIRRTALAKVPIDMTPMIDVVFQLMAFFIMTFSIVAPEGDFSIKMPLGRSDGTAPPVEAVPIRVRLEADSAGGLARLQMGDRDLQGDFKQLRAELLALVPDAQHPGLHEGSEGPSVSVEIDSDYGLDYAHTIDALTAVTGYRNRDGQIIRILDNVRFAPPRK